MIYNKLRLFTVAALCAAVLFHSCAGSAVPREAESASGFCEGSAQGRRGPISVRVRIEDGTIAGIEITESGEDPFVGGAAMEELLELVLLYNSTDLDAVSGATESSRGFLSAVENAILNYEWYLYER